jgi:hypothetical protein
MTVAPRWSLSLEPEPPLLEVNSAVFSIDGQSPASVVPVTVTEKWPLAAIVRSSQRRSPSASISQSSLSSIQVRPSGRSSVIVTSRASASSDSFETMTV